MSTRYLYGDSSPAIVTIATNQAVEVGDIVAMTSGTLTRAEDEAWDTNLATTQEAFVAKFLGISAQKKAAGATKPYGNSVDNRTRADSEGVFEFDCASASFAVGDYVGPAKQSGDALESQKVVAVATEARAIGRVMEATSSSTRVKVRILSKLLPKARQS